MPVAAASDESYVLVRDPGGGTDGELIELPVNAGSTQLALLTVEHAFPGAYGLKYKNPATGASRVVLYVRSLC